MKPLHVGLLVAAGAVCGAIVMQVWQRPHPAVAPAPAAAVAPAAVTPPAEPPAPVAQGPLPPVEEPAPMDPAPARSRKPARVHVQEARTVRAAARPPAVIARAQPFPPPSAAATQAAPAAAPAPVPTAPEPPPPQPDVSNPPARTEPENTTPPPAAPAPRPEPHKVTLNTGSLIPVRLVDGLSSERNATGDTFLATLDKELVADGFVIAERGARVEGRVVAADRGKMHGAQALSVELVAVHTSDGQRVAVQTERFDKQSEAASQQNAEKVGGGAAVGAIIGAIAGGGKGAAIGAGVGGAAGAGDVLLTHGKPATLGSETRITFRLRAPVTITEKVY